MSLRLSFAGKTRKIAALCRSSFRSFFFLSILAFDARAENDNGRFADLVILKSNPLDDIAHVSDIAIVIKNDVVAPAELILR